MPQQDTRESEGEKRRGRSSRSFRMAEPWKDLDGKVVLVTGASSGIGRDLCLDLARAGGRIVAAARRTDRLQSLCDEINKGISRPSDDITVVRCASVEMDVRADEATIRATVKKAWDKFGRIDTLINNAGIRGAVNSSLDWSEEDWRSLMNTNLTGLWLVSKHVCRLMRDAKQKGCVVNISSIAGLTRGQSRGGAPYVASKSAVNSLTKVMAMELGVYNIRVNAIAPGLFKSEITEDLMKNEWLINIVATKASPLRTFGTLDPALTSLTRYLIHDSSQYVTGNIFIVDSGITLPGPIFSSL